MFQAIYSEPEINRIVAECAAIQARCVAIEIRILGRRRGVPLTELPRLADEPAPGLAFPPP
jgi:hypothetical protein